MFKVLLIILIILTSYAGKAFIPRKHISVRSHRLMDHHRTLTTLRQKRKAIKEDKEYEHNTKTE